MGKELDVVSLNKWAWEHVADIYAKKDPVDLSNTFVFFCNCLSRRARILDVGCGTGVPFAQFLVEKGFQVVGIDISSRMVQLAKKNVPQATYRVLSMTDLDYDEEFDGIVASYSMLLLDPPRFKIVAQKIINSLKKRGMFYLSLNEPKEEDSNVDEEVVVKIMGETMYSRAYTREEVLEVFVPMNMKLLRFQRQVIFSKEFGEEHMIEFVFKRT
ncbi:MAG: class I SAM-dependent methyltransferase [Candidatus Heimdallarchaeota archaeon]